MHPKYRFFTTKWPIFPWFLRPPTLELGNLNKTMPILTSKYTHIHVVCKTYFGLSGRALFSYMTLKITSSPIAKTSLVIWLNCEYRQSYIEMSEKHYNGTTPEWCHCYMGSEKIETANNKHSINNYDWFEITNKRNCKKQESTYNQAKIDTGIKSCSSLWQINHFGPQIALCSLHYHYMFTQKRFIRNQNPTQTNASTIYAIQHKFDVNHRHHVRLLEFTNIPLNYLMYNSNKIELLEKRFFWIVCCLCAMWFDCNSKSSSLNKGTIYSHFHQITQDIYRPPPT